jgi:predicted ATPase/class 3 adenylate cyclase
LAVTDHGRQEAVQQMAFAQSHMEGGARARYRTSLMVDFPTGTVTFLFTDIEGSTRLLRGLGEAYESLQDEHASIMRAAIAQGSGVEIRTEGDAFFVAFPTPGGAVRAAVAAQRGLAAFPWPEGGQVRVRMGMHTGDGVLGGDDYVGIDVNRAARIAATGHGGQVVVSEPTRALLEDALPEGVSFRDLGVHRIKDFDRAEHLHDLLIDGLDSGFPALRSLDARRTNLPTLRSTFVGRATEIAEVDRLLDGTRLLTLTGPGGTGKTRLALQVAWERLDRHPDGVFFVDLSSVSDPGLVTAEIAGALRVRAATGEDLPEALVEHLHDHDLLLVLDNLEQLIGAGSTIGTLLDAAPRLTVLVTSRIPLRVAGEQEYPVLPLALPDADHLADASWRSYESVELFTQRAAAVRPGLRITDADGPAVVRIVERLDGLPLALELAASRLRVLDLEALAARIDRRLPLLTGGARDLPERQRTLTSTIAWSHDLLGPHEQRLFARLCVFAGGCTLDEAEAICGDDLDVLDGLGELVDASLVRRIQLADGTLRFRMLETIREYAADQLATGDEQEREALQRAHSAYFRDLAEEAEPFLTSDHQVTWLATLERELDNLRAVLDRADRDDPDTQDIENGLRIAGAIWRFWQQRGRLPEGRARLERMLARPEAQRRDAVRARALGALGSIVYWQGDQGLVLAPYQEAVEIARELGDRRLLAQALLNRSFVQDFSPEAMDQRVRLLQESLEVAGEGDVFLQGQIWSALGYLQLFSGDIAGASESASRALALMRESGDRFALCETLVGLAGLAFFRGDIDEVRRRLGEATALVTDGSSPFNVNVFALLLPYARIANEEGRHDDAASFVGAYNRVEDDYDLHIPDIGVAFLGDPRLVAKEALGDDAYERAWAKGYALTLEQMLTLAAHEASLGP